MNVLYKGRKYPWIYDPKLTIDDLKELHRISNSPTQKMLITKQIKERLGLYKPQSQAFEWAQKHNFLLFQAAQLLTFVKMYWAISGLTKENEIAKKYASLYRQTLRAIGEVHKNAEIIQELLKNISKLHKEEKQGNKS